MMEFPINVTLVKSEQFLKAELPIVATESGIVILVRLEHP